MDKMVFEEAEKIINLVDARFCVAGDTLVQGSPYLPPSCVLEGDARKLHGADV